MDRALMSTHVETVVLVEGESDRGAVRALARRRGCDLEACGVDVIAMSGATNIARFLSIYGPAGLDLRVAGLCDIGELGYVARALHEAGLVSDLTVEEFEAAGFYACDADLEEELIRALGPRAVVAFIESQGELRRFRTFQKQPAQRDRGLEPQLHRFIGTKAGRNVRYGAAMIDAVDLDRAPRPLALLVEDLCRA